MNTQLAADRGKGGQAGRINFCRSPENAAVLLLLLLLLAAAVYVAYSLNIMDFLSPEKDYKCRDCNVILITIDTLRWDHVGYMGYFRNTTPTLDRLASEGVVFEKTFAQSSFTPPCLGSILTSRYVSDHGLKTWNMLDDNQTTLPEVLEANGYQTAAFTRVPKLFEQNLGQGVQYTDQGNYWRAEDFNRAALQWVDNEQNGKFFMWLHYYDPHRRYEPPKPFDTMFNRKYNPKRDVQRSDKTFFQKFWRGDVNISKREEWDLITQYDGEIAYADRQIGLLLGNLSARGLLDNTIIIITADHGEALDEHNGSKRTMFVHDPMLYDQVTRIPLIFLGTNIPGGVRVDALVESIDITPTILSTLDLDYNSTIMYGRDLAPYFGGKAEGGRTDVYGECWGWEDMKMVRSDRYKYIKDIKHKREELYDLQADPGELNNIADESKDVLKDFRLKLESFMNRHQHTPAKETNMSKDLERRLRDLGYIN